MREVNADALYDFLSRLFDPNRSAPHRTELDVALPKVAEPEQPKLPECDPYCMAGSSPCRKCRERAKSEQPKYDYHADWEYHPEYEGKPYICRQCGAVQFAEPTARHDHAECRARTRKHPTPSEPVIDEAVYDAAIGAMNQWLVGHGNPPRMRTAIETDVVTAAVLADRELRGVRLVGHNDTQTRSNACGGSSRSSSSESLPPPAIEDATAPDADPRLTDEEVWAAFEAEDRAAFPGLLPQRRTRERLTIARAVADAQLAKAAKPVTISEAELKRWWTSQTNLGDLFALLRRRGVEVVG